MQCGHRWQTERSTSFAAWWLFCQTPLASWLFRLDNNDVIIVLTKCALSYERLEYYTAMHLIAKMRLVRSGGDNAVVEQWPIQYANTQCLRVNVILSLNWRLSGKWDRRGDSEDRGWQRGPRKRNELTESCWFRRSFRAVIRRISICFNAQVASDIVCNDWWMVGGLAVRGRVGGG